MSDGFISNILYSLRVELSKTGINQSCDRLELDSTPGPTFSATDYYKNKYITKQTW